MSQLGFAIQNNSGIPSANIYIGFWGSTLNATINGSAMNADQWYQLSSITNMEINSTTSGRIYVTYQDSSTAPTFSPNSSILATGSPAYNECFDKFELTFDGSSYGVADLTAIDFWSIPMSLQTMQGGAPVAELYGVKAGSTVQDIYNGLTPLSNPVQSTSTANAIISAFNSAGNALPTGIQQQMQSPASGLVVNNGNFVRIIGPNSYPPFGVPSQNQFPGLPFTPYNTFMEYFQYLISTFGPGTSPQAPFTQLGNGKIAHIKGNYGGSTLGCGNACAQQSYDLWASIDSNFTLTLSGTGSVVGNINLVVTEWNLLDPASTYGGNPNFSLNGGPVQSPQNNIYAWIFGDFFAGLNIGAIGSAVAVGGSVVGEMPSSDWFSILPPSGMLFNKLWGSGVTNYWNQWAQVLNPLSDAYNFAYAERFSAPQISLNPATVDTLNLILQALPTPPQGS